VALYVLNLERRQIEHTYWLNKQASINSFLAEMAALGFPAHTWGGRAGQIPLSVAIPSTLPQMRGLRFRARKTSRFVAARPAGGGLPAREANTYHDLRIASRIRGAAMPISGGEKEIERAVGTPAGRAPAPPPPPQPQPKREVFSPADTSDIPF
jgi:hypothetical protein